MQDLIKKAMLTSTMYRSSTNSSSGLSSSDRFTPAKGTFLKATCHPHNRINPLEKEND
jgi:hypothetical protein